MRAPLGAGRGGRGLVPLLLLYAPQGEYTPVGGYKNMEQFIIIIIIGYTVLRGAHLTTTHPTPH